MYIAPINFYSSAVGKEHKKNLNSTLSFSGSIGRFDRVAVQKISSVTSAYQDIISKLSCKTDEGLEYIQKNFPDISIGEGLTFHNCGENKVSIAIKTAESSKYSGLTKIIVKKGHTTWSEKITLDSFLLKDNDKLVKNFDKTHLKQFPEVCEFETQTAVEEVQNSGRLAEVLEDLDFAMLKFRQYLKNLGDQYKKLPDGIIPYATLSKIDEVDKLSENLNSLRDAYSSKMQFNMRQGFDDYVPVLGMKGDMFRSDEGELVYYSKVNSSKFQNLKRLIVYDKDKNPIKLFNIVDNQKFIANSNVDYPAYLPEKPLFANEKELYNDNFLPEFNKYLSIYQNKMKAFKVHLDKFLLKYNSSIGELPLENIQAIQKINSLYNSIGQKLKVSNSSKIKNSYAGLEVAAGKRGLTFLNYDVDKKVAILPLNTKNEKNLLRITILNSDDTINQAYLIKDEKNVVSNYNINYPNIIPPNLKFYKEFELAELNLEAVLKFLNAELENFENHIDIALQPKVVVKTVQPVTKDNLPKITKSRTDKTKIKQTEQEEMLKEKMDIKNTPQFAKLVKECNMMLSQAMKGIGDNLDDFNKSLDEIQKRVTAFFEKNQ